MKQIYTAQKNEITEYHIYSNIARLVKEQKNKKVILDIANEELRHAKFWQTITKKDIKPDRWQIFKFTLIARFLGFTFAIKLMEKGEEQAQVNYMEIAEYIPEAEQIAEEEEKHENELINLLDEERLNYMGSIVLGLNDALVELTGSLAGLSFALQKTRLIAAVGIITGIAASLSMGASEYLSTKAEGNTEKALKSSLYTGAAYIITVLLLVLPYFIFDNYFFALMTTLIVGVLIIFLFNYYVSIAKDLPFRKRFLEMTFLSLGIAALSFVIGIVIRVTLGADI
ncbi:VIT1/CCC1 transporter family protein [candidate division WOR-3 bacterium]|nr:VIT1/CCC1 transporter family protein [candidate division WOR-3 bacterium]